MIAGGLLLAVASGCSAMSLLFFIGDLIRAKQAISY